MNINRYKDSVSFLHDIESFLLLDEYMNNLFLGLLYRLKKKPVNPNDLFLSITHENQQIVFLISGLYLIVYANTTDQLIYSKSINYLLDHQIDYPGIIGSVSHCQAFVKAYLEVIGKPLNLVMSQRIYVNKEVTPVSNLKANIVLATDKHSDFLIDWIYEFLIDTYEKPTMLTAKERLDALLITESLYLLEYENQFVCMAASTRPFQRGISVGYVYTPPTYRNQGYATKCVELLTEKLLEVYDYCTLYTDLANPTSNRIYQKIGYKPIGDSVVYTK